MGFGMISFSLKCSKDHHFDSWFANSQNFDTLQSAGHLSCPICGDGTIAKALMAPAIAQNARPDAADTPALSTPHNDFERALAQMRAHIEANSDYVGLNFAAEARAMHDGQTPARPIFGEAKPDEARALLEDGIPVAPLPFLPRAKVN